MVVIAKMNYYLQIKVFIFIHEFNSYCICQSIVTLRYRDRGILVRMLRNPKGTFSFLLYTIKEIITRKSDKNFKQSNKNGILN